MRKSKVWIPIAALLAVGLLAGCGGGDSDPAMTAQETCESGGGRYNADGSCTSAADLAAETETAAIAKAIADAKSAADALSASSSLDDITAAEALATTARRAIIGAEHASASSAVANLAAIGEIDKTISTAETSVRDRIAAETAMAERVEAQTETATIAKAIADAKSAADALSASSSPGDVAAAQDLATAARVAIIGAEHASALVTATRLTQLGDIDTTIATADTNVKTRIAAETAKAARAEVQVADIRTAAAAVDTSDLSTADNITAARQAIARLQTAIDAAVDVDDTSMYDSQVTAANMKVREAQESLDHADQTKTLADAVAELRDIDLAGLTDQTKINEAEAIIRGLRTALDGATALSDAEKSAAEAYWNTASRTVKTAQENFDTNTQKMDLNSAVADLKAIDLGNLVTQDDINAARRAVTKLDQALADATQLSNSEKLDAIVDATVARRAVDSAQETLTASIGTQRMALMDAGNDLANLDLDDLDTTDKVGAAKTAATALKAALDRATHLSDDEKSKYQTQLSSANNTIRVAETGMGRDDRRKVQMGDVDKASTALATALAALAGDEAPTQAQITAAETALTALKKAISDAADLTAAETADETREVIVAEGRITGAKQARTVADAAERTRKADEQETATAAMIVTAATLYDGLEHGLGDGTNVRMGAYAGANDSQVNVTIGTNAAVPLSEDRDTTVADNYGWEGKRYTAEPDDDGTYEAVVYSDVGEPTQGKKFGNAEAGDAYEYTLVNGMYTIDAAADPTNAVKVGGTGFDDLTAGVKVFPLPSPNPDGATRVSVSGTFHGVSGTYRCEPVTGQSCAASKTTDGFTLGLRNAAAGTFAASDTAWKFTPSNPEARVTDTPDREYASYGWWLHKDGDAWTAGVFVDYKNAAVPTAENVTALQGTATYRGGAAGKYALASPTGGTNDAGHFTASAMLEADFGNGTDVGTITGTIDHFMGADGKPRDWSVELMEQGIGNDGTILGNGATNAPGPARMTEWTIGGTTGEADGQWSGHLRDTDATATDVSGVPKFATGTFYSEFGTAGRMIGAFGATKDDN